MLLLTCAASGTPGAAFLRVDFTRSLYAPGSPPEEVKGALYYSPNGRVYIEIISPVNQHITLNGKEMILYYPKDRRAFVFTSNIPQSLPFASAFMGSLRDNLGMPELGYSASTVETHGDSIISTWNPPSALKKVAGKVVLTEVHGVVCLSESYTAEGTLSTRALYKNHASIKQGMVPMEIYGGWQTPQGWTRENILFSNPTPMTTLPAHLNNFIIPADVKPRRVQW